MEQGLRAILQEHLGQRILIVGHRATNRVLLGTLLAWPRERWAELRLRNKYFYRIRIGATTDIADTDIATYALSGSDTGACHNGFIM